MNNNNNTTATHSTIFDATSISRTVFISSIENPSLGLTLSLPAEGNQMSIIRKCTRHLMGNTDKPFKVIFKCARTGNPVNNCKQLGELFLIGGPVHLYASKEYKAEYPFVDVDDNGEEKSVPTTSHLESDSPTVEDNDRMIVKTEPIPFILKDSEEVESATSRKPFDSENNCTEENNIWSSKSDISVFEENQRKLREFGYSNDAQNARLLCRFDNDLRKVIFVLERQRIKEAKKNRKRVMKREKKLAKVERKRADIECLSIRYEPLHPSSSSPPPPLPSSFVKKDDCSNIVTFDTEENLDCEYFCNDEFDTSYKNMKGEDTRSYISQDNRSSTFSENMKKLVELGYTRRGQNARLLHKCNNDIDEVIAILKVRKAKAEAKRERIREKMAIKTERIQKKNLLREAKLCEKLEKMNLKENLVNSRNVEGKSISACPQMKSFSTSSSNSTSSSTSSSSSEDDGVLVNESFMESKMTPTFGENMKKLVELGYTRRGQNARLLHKCNNDISHVVAKLEKHRARCEAKRAKRLAKTHRVETKFASKVEKRNQKCKRKTEKYEQRNKVFLPTSSTGKRETVLVVPKEGGDLHIKIRYDTEKSKAF